MIVDELITLLKFDTEGMSNAKAFDTVLSKIEEHSKAIVVGLTGAIASVGYFADRVSKSVAKNYEWAKSVGVASDSYQRFEHAAEVVGGSLDDIKGDLEGWVRSAKASGQTLEEVFLRETDSIKGMSHEQAYALLKARGYSDTSIKLIQQGEGELKKFLNQAEIIPEENLKAAEDYAKTWREVTSQVNQLMADAVASALPALKSVLNTIRDFVQRNKELVKGTVSAFFKSVAVALKIVFAALTPLIRGIEFLIKAFDILTFGVGKHVIIVGALTAAFTALAIAAGIKAVKGIASLMGNLSSMINIAGKAIGYMAEMTLEIAANGVKQTFLNSTLATGVQLWWLEFKARIANLGAQIKNLIYAGKELISMTIGNTKLGIRIGLWWLETKAQIANTMAKKSGIVYDWLLSKATLAQVVAHKLSVFWINLNAAALSILRVYHIGGAKAAAYAAGVYTQKFIVAIMKSTKSLIVFGAKFTFVMIKSILAAIPLIVKFSFSIAVGLVKSILAAIPLIMSFAAGFFSAVIPALIAATSAVWAFTAALLANPLTWIVVAIVAAIAAIGAAVYAVIKYWDQIVDAVMACVNWVVDLFSWMKNGNSTLAKTLKYVTMFLSPLTAIYFYWDEIVAAIQRCWDKLKAFFNWWWSSYKAFWSSAWNKVVGFFGKIKTWIGNLFSSIKDLFSKLWNLLHSGLQNFLSSAWNKVVGFFGKIKTWIGNLFSSIKDLFSKPVKEIWSMVTGLFGRIIDGVKSLGKTIWGVIKDTVLSVVNFVLGLISDAVNFAIDCLNTIIKGINMIPGVDIPQVERVDFKIKKEKPADKDAEKKKEEEGKGPNTMAPSAGKQEPVLSPAPVIEPDIEVMAPSAGKQEPVIQPETPPVIIEQATMSQEQPRQELARDSMLPPDTREKQDVVFEETGAVRSFNPANVPPVDVAAEQAKAEQALLDVLQSAAPANAVPVGQAAVAMATPGQVTNNNQRSSSYVDQRNITINTNATSGPAIAAYMRGTNDMMSAGVGMAGAF